MHQTPCSISLFFFIVCCETSASMVITAAQAQARQTRQERPESMAIAKMIEKTEKTILACSEQGMQAAHITVPTFLIGVPIYDKDEVAYKVMEVFRDNGFIVKLDEPDSFSVSWKPVKPQVRRSDRSEPLFDSFDTASREDKGEQRGAGAALQEEGNDNAEDQDDDVQQVVTVVSMPKSADSGKKSAGVRLVKF